MANRGVLIVDPCRASARRLEEGFRELGYRTAFVEDADAALDFAHEWRPELLISEQQIGGKSWLDLLTSVRAANLSPDFVVVTACASITNAVAATRAGVAAYFAKPVTANDVVLSLDPAISKGRRETLPPPYLSLARAKWEYINMTVSNAGSIAEAARRLCIERRSLRRMLAKHPPPR